MLLAGLAGSTCGLQKSDELLVEEPLMQHTANPAVRLNGQGIETAEEPVGPCSLFLISYPLPNFDDLLPKLIIHRNACESHQHLIGLRCRALPANTHVLAVRKQLDCDGSRFVPVSFFPDELDGSDSRRLVDLLFHFVSSFKNSLFLYKHKNALSHTSNKTEIKRFAVF